MYTIPMLQNLISGVILCDKSVRCWGIKTRFSWEKFIFTYVVHFLFIYFGNSVTLVRPSGNVGINHNWKQEWNFRDMRRRLSPRVVPGQFWSGHVYFKWPLVILSWSKHDWWHWLHVTQPDRLNTPCARNPRLIGSINW